MSAQTPRPRVGALSLRDVCKSYGEVHAVDHVNLDVLPGEFITLLGPSGSGKTTTLRIIAGLIQHDAGSVILDGQDLSSLPPHRRDMGVVFQNYALFPHLTAGQNVAFPLEMRGVARAEVRRRVDEALRRVHLEGLADRSPRQLSGGQQQRVALARAIVFAPRLLLMDEPLGALDKKLREALQLEIVRLSRELGITVLYVTHDQEEALVMSDRVAIYNRGGIEQLGTGEELYERPATLFVANFVGESNVFRGDLADTASGWVLRRQSGPAPNVSADARARAGLGAGDRAALVVRPERTRIWRNGVPAPDAAGGPLAASLAGRVQSVIYLGAARKYLVDLADGTTITVRRQVDERESDPRPGEDVLVGWSVDHGIVVADDPAAAASPADLAAEDTPIPAQALTAAGPLG